MHIDQLFLLRKRNAFSTKRTHFL